MKKFLFLLATTFSTLSTVSLIESTITDTNPQLIINTVNYKFHKDNNTSGKTNSLEEICLFNYKKYDNSWENFIQKYQTFSLLNFYANAGGSGQSVGVNKFMIKTERLLSYSSILCHYNSSGQDATISLKFQDVDGYICAIADLITSNNGSSTVWAEIGLTNVNLW